MLLSFRDAVAFITLRHRGIGSGVSKSCFWRGFHIFTSDSLIRKQGWAEIYYK